MPGKRTREAVAACSALGLSYWSDHPKLGRVWAVDAKQSPHIVRVDRQNSTARHECYRDDRMESGMDRCPQAVGEYVGYETPNSTDEMAKKLMFADAAVTELPVPSLRQIIDESDTIVVGHIGPAVDAQVWGADRAAALINDTPSCVSTLHIDYLVACLGHTNHDDLIREELNRRKDAS